MRTLAPDCIKLGFGMMRLPKREDGTIDVGTTAQMVDEFLAAGGRYVDTAFVYEGSEDAVRQALVERHPRDSYYLATKLNAGEWAAKDEAAAKAEFEQSLERTGAGYFDFYLLHALSSDSVGLYDKYGIWEYVRDLKARGLVRHMGFSFHDGPELLDRLLTEHPEVEFVQLQLNYLDWDYINTKALYEIADEFGKTVVVMEPLRGGTLSRMPSAEGRKILDAASTEHGLSYTDFAFGWLESLPRVGWILSGMAEPEQVYQNTDFFSREEGLTAAEIDAAYAAGKAMSKEVFVPCTKCNYCADCPSGIKISKIFSAYNEACAKDFVYLWGDLKKIYKDIGPNANDCVHCGNCEKRCPQHIPIPDMLKKIDEKYNSL